jgi:hypothetical protein
MRLRLACCALALLAVSCVKRIAPSAGDDRTVVSGVPLVFGADTELPEGTEATWDFGDGTPPVKGGRVEHAFPRAGTFIVTETIRDADGQVRTSTAHVTVMRRSVPMAVPADVRAALILQTPWSKIPVHREVAGKLALGQFFDEAARSVSEAIGFDALDPTAAQANGFDPDEGVAFYTVPQDPEALVVAVGTSDDAKALAAARRMLTHGVGRLAGGPFQLSEAKLDDGTPVLVGLGAAGEKVGVLQRYGYLYLRSAGATDPLAALKSAAALPPDKGLAMDARYLAAIRHVGSGDAIFYSRPPEGAEPEQRNRFSSELGSSAFSVNDRSELLQVRFFSQLRNLTGEQLVSAFKPLKPPPDLAAKLPSGAAAYFRLSAAPQSLWRELNRAAPADAARLRDRVLEATGLDLEKDLIPSFTGNVGVAIFLDAQSLMEAIMGEQVGSLDRSVFLAVAELEKPDLVETVLDRAMAQHPPADRFTFASAKVYRLSEGAQAALKDGLLFLSIGGAPPAAEEEEPPPPPRGKKSKKKPPVKPKPPPTAEELGPLGLVLSPPKNTLSLGQELYGEGVRGFDVAGLQAAWVDVAGIVHSVERAATEQGGIAGAAARLFADRAANLRDGLFQVRATPDGLEAELFIRFRARRANGGGGH